MSDEPFAFVVNNVQPFSFWYEVYPEYNDYYYYVDIISVAEYESRYGNDENMISSLEKELKDKYVDDYSNYYSFTDTMLTKGAYFGYAGNLQEDTDYYLFAFPYSDDGKAIDNVCKMPVTTKKFIPSDISFDISMYGSVVTVAPSNDDSYFFDIEESETVWREYGNPYYFYEIATGIYDQFDLIESNTFNGIYHSDLSQFYELSPGDRFYLVCSGYDDGRTSDVGVYSLTYNGPDKPGDVKQHFIDKED